MAEQTPSVAIDIGGGRGQYFVERARAERDKTFLILDPNPVRLMRKPPNLHVVQWGSDINWGLPLLPNSIDEANINFLHGEIADRSGSTHTEENTEYARYERLISQLKGVLKKGAIVRIVDVRFNILTISSSLEKQGFTIISEPSRLKDEDRSEWTREFFRVFNKAGKSEEASVALPMELVARR